MAIINRETPSSASLASARRRSTDLVQHMVGLQEELDWHCYRLYGLVEQDLHSSCDHIPSIRAGERAFEIALARKVEAGELETSWFERHGLIPVTEPPPHWPQEFREMVEERISLIESDRNIGLVEQPEYKRRWNLESWDQRQARALRLWLLGRLEGARFWQSIELTSCARLADQLGSDEEFRLVAGLYRGRPDFDLVALVVELVEAESAPLLRTLRYTGVGCRKRTIWERTWDLQWCEDVIDAEVGNDAAIPELLKTETAKKRKAAEIGEIAAPPKYEPKDFQRPNYWSVRGKLDVPKERFVSFPHCERDVDPTQLIAWAGWDHLQLAQAIAAYYERVKNHEGWTRERRVPLLTGILELLPWLKQWHNNIHPEYQERMGDFFQQFVEDEARTMEMTLEEIRGWTPPVQSGTRGRKKRST